MTVADDILDLLVCPESHQKLRWADQALIDSLNERVSQGELKTHGGTSVSEPLSRALVRQDGKCLYRVDDDIPNMLVDERIDLVLVGSSSGTSD